MNYFLVGFHAVAIALYGVPMGVHGISWRCCGTVHGHGAAMKAKGISWAFTGLSRRFTAVPWVFLAPIMAMP